MDIRGVNYLLVRTDGYILFQKRCMNAKSSPGLWCIPGGGREAGETPKQAVIREIEEETEVVVKPNECYWLTDFTYRLKDGTIAVNRVFISFVEDARVVCHEGEEMRWMSLDEAETLELACGENTLFPTVREALKINRMRVS